VGDRFVVGIEPRDYAPFGGAPFSDEGEPVTALMVTGKDPDHAGLARNSVLSFLAQTHPNRRLVIVNDGAYRFDVAGVPEGRVVQLNLAERRTLGELRNLSLEEVPPDGVWVQWDDDWHHPNLLADQYARLVESDAEACFLEYQVKYAFSRNAGWLDGCDWGFAGSIMARRKEGVLYEFLKLGEDSGFQDIYRGRYRCVVWDNPPHYYLRFIHGYNAWDDEHFRLDRRRRGSRRGLDRESRAYLDRITPLYRGVVKP
jgi:glycosyltransferase involved in cell wall biosynthesis